MALFKIVVWAIIFLTKSILIVRIVVFLSNQSEPECKAYIFTFIYKYS